MIVATVLSGCANSALQRGQDALGQGRYTEAIAAFDQAEREVPAAEMPLTEVAGAHRARAMVLVDAGQCNAARPHLDRAEALTRVVLADRQAMYRCAATHGAPPTVLAADLERTVELGDNRLEVRHTLMRLQLDLGEDDKAIGHVPFLSKRRALTLDDHARLLGAFDRAGQLIQAKPHAVAVLTTRPDDLLLRLKLAEIEELLGDTAAAERRYRALTLDHPSNPAMFLRLGAFLEARGDRAGARAARARADALRGIDRSPRQLRPLRPSRK